MRDRSVISFANTLAARLRHKPPEITVQEFLETDSVLAEHPEVRLIAKALAETVPASPLVYSVEEAEKVSKYSASWLAKERVSGGGPPFIKKASKILYPVREFHEWLLSQTFKHTGESKTRPDLKGKPPVGKGEKRSSLDLFDERG